MSDQVDPKIREFIDVLGTFYSVEFKPGKESHTDPNPYDEITLTTTCDCNRERKYVLSGQNMSVESWAISRDN